MSKSSDPLGAHFETKASSFCFSTGYQSIVMAPGAVIVKCGTICKKWQMFTFFENFKNIWLNYDFVLFGTYLVESDWYFVVRM